MVTSLARRTFSGDVLTDTLGPYANETIAVSKSLGLPVGVHISFSFTVDHGTTHWVFCVVVALTDWFDGLCLKTWQSRCNEVRQGLQCNYSQIHRYDSFKHVWSCTSFFAEFLTQPHCNRLGSLYFGRIVADEVMKYVSALAPHIVVNATLSAKIAAGTL